MPESSFNNKVLDSQSKIPPSVCKLRNSEYVLGGVIIGTALGQVSNYLLPTEQDIFTKTESDVLKVTTPAKNKEWKLLIDEIIKSRRAAKYNIIGAIAGGGAALIYSLIKNRQNKEQYM